jgi:hypothetical protein
MSISNCCGAYVDEDILICSECKEHCEAIPSECSECGSENINDEGVCEECGHIHKGLLDA